MKIIINDEFLRYTTQHFKSTLQLVDDTYFICKLNFHGLNAVLNHFWSFL